MRIRKVAQVYALTPSSNSLPQAYDCGFSQSPWDVMTEFSPPSSPLPPPQIKSYHLALTSSSNSLTQAHACGFNQSPWDIKTEFSPPSSPLPPPPIKSYRFALTSSSNSLPQAHACGFNESPWDVMTEFSPPSSPLPPPPIKSYRLALTSSSNSLPQAHACGFNQSPWDVKTEFSPPSSLLPPPPTKVNGDGLSAMNEISGTYISLMERDEGTNDVTSQNFECMGGDNGGCADEEKSNDRELVCLCSMFDGKNRQCMRNAMYGDTLCEHHLALANKHISDGLSDKKNNKSSGVVATKGGKRKVREGVVLCRKMGGKSWHYKREAMHGNTLSEYHLDLDNNDTRIGSSYKKITNYAEVVKIEGGKINVQTKKAPVEAADPFGICYYSGFGPQWGKNRGDDKEKNVRDNKCWTHLEL